MWHRLRSLSRSRRGESPGRSDLIRPESFRKISDSSTSTRISRVDTLNPTPSLGEDVLGDPLGLSVLYTPDETPAVDLIFVHGLGGASVKTWCKGYNRDLCWPKFWLPEDLGLKKVRVLTFGYNAEVLSKSKTKANISDFAKGLLAAMKYEKNGAMEDLGIGKVPIVFVVHSMGGLVFKKAYLRGRHDKDYESIVSQIRAVVFLSTPHRGSNLADTLDKILSTSLTSYARKAYVTELAKNSSTVEELNEDFRHQVSDLEIYSFYELNSTVIKGSHSAMIVPKSSSILGYSEEKSIPLEADHHGVCKFSDRGDVNYKSVVSVLKTVVATHVDQAEKRNAASAIESMHKIEDLLAITTYPEEDYQALRDHWTPGTCEGLLRNRTFTAWLQKTNAAGILWMHAGPGRGKSIMSSFLINHLMAAGNVCQYYFFKYDDTIKRSANTFFRCLAYQISRDMPSFRTALMELADDKSYSGRTESRQLWKTLFESSLYPLKFEQPIFWIIDGIDEADSISTIIANLKKLPRALPIRIILVSRHLPAISTSLGRSSDAMPVDTIKIDDNHNDIRFYIQKEVVYLPGDANFHKIVVKELVQRSEGNFLWVHLALQELLEMHSQEDLSHILDEMPRGMESMYERMEISIGKLSKATDQSLARTLLMWAAYGKRPLHLKELVRVLKSSFSSLIDLRSSIKQVCGHFITVDSSDRVSLFHSTARDYLRHASKLPFSLESRSAHEELFNATMRVLLDPQLRSRLSDKELPPFCEYASTSWPYHLARTSADSDGVLSILVKFLTGPFVLPWIEALAISRQLGNLVYASTTLTSFVQHRRRRNAGTNPLLHRLSDLRLLEIWALDLLKVVGKFGAHLIQDPAAVYKFIPQLCPMNSALYQQFGKSSLAQISVSGLSIADWDDLSSRLSTGTSHQAALICCSARYLAVSTSANKILVWNAVSFDQILSLDHDEHIFQLSFNELGDSLVSYGVRTTKVWDLPQGSEVYRISNLRNTKPLKMTFMDSDSAVLICSDTREFWRFDLDTADEGWQKTYSSVFKGEVTMKDAYTNTPASMAFNNDVSQIAVAYRGAPLEVWDLASSKIVNRCKRRSWSDVKRKQPWTGVNHVLWHPTNCEILGLYTDGAVFKWQPLSEAHTEFAEVSDNSPSDIKIAPNGVVFLTSDVNGTLKIHNYHDFVTIYQLSSGDIITSMCFSPDSQRVYDIRGSYCNVWEPNALIRISESDDQISDVESDIRSMSSVSLIPSDAWVDSSIPITTLAASPQGSLVCVGDDEGNVMLHDIENESKLQIATSAVGMGIERIAWSEDGRYLAYEDLGRRLILSSLLEQRESTSGFTWKLSRLLDTKSNLGDDIMKELLIKPDASMLLAAGTKSIQLWSIQPKKSTTYKIPFPVAAWSNNHSSSKQFLAFEGHKVTAFFWSTEVLQQSSEWRLEYPSTDTEDTASVSRVITPPNGEYILLLCSQQGHQYQGSGFHNVRIIRKSDFSPSRKTIPAFEPPSSITALVEQPLTILGSDQFVFIDKSFWICTWRFDLQRLVGKGAGQAEREAEVVKSPRIQDSDALSKLGVTRQFFIPRDWVNANSLALCTILSDGTFLCPRKGEVAVIRSGLGSEW